MVCVWGDFATTTTKPLTYLSDVFGGRFSGGNSTHVWKYLAYFSTISFCPYRRTDSPVTDLNFLREWETTNQNRNRSTASTQQKFHRQQTKPPIPLHQQKQKQTDTSTAVVSLSITYIIKSNIKRKKERREERVRRCGIVW